MIGLIVSHSQLPQEHVWAIAAVFSIAMNFTYLIEAISLKSYVKLEALVAILLIMASLLGVFISPLFVISAIFAHGVWDINKHYGKGIAFFSWYTLGCALVDFTYSGALLWYWIAH